MKQVLHNLKNGNLTVEQLPPPVLRDQGILVRSRASLISAGTDRMMIRLAGKSLVGKARARPDLVRKVLAKLQRDGFWATLRTVRDRLDRALPLGYSVSGEVVRVGAEARQFALGQRVACAGAGYANHAEINYIPRLLAVPVPPEVSTEAAAYATVGAIALQGLRNAEVRVGESVAVLGLGLIGQLAVQLLKASGCRVVGVDVDADRLKLAGANGADLALPVRHPSLAREIREFTRGRGADAVLITAATASNAPIELAARLARDRARVVMVGVTGMEIPRKPYYEKELTLVVSRSYGPGRYDRQYEEHGRDYPAGYVRWTENRNMEAFLDLVAAGQVRPEVCTTHRFPIGDAVAAFELILTNREPHLGVMLTYPDDPDDPAACERTRISLPDAAIARGRRAAGSATERLGVSFIGAGNFARTALLPTLAKSPAVALRGVVTASGRSAQQVGTKFGFCFCTSSESEIYEDAETDVVFVLTPHSQHARIVCRALAAGKSVFVEKPLAITPDQLRRVCSAYQSHPHGLMVGFNRRFSPLGVELGEWARGRGPLNVSYRTNAGPLDDDHWIADPAEGGRIIGEACHFFDFFAYLTGASPRTVYAVATMCGAGRPAHSATRPAHSATQPADDTTVTVTYTDDSVCQLIYTAAGPPSLSKERIEVFAGGGVAVLTDFRRLEIHSGAARPRRRKLLGADKGHRGQLEQFLKALRSGEPMPIGIESLVSTTLVSFAALRSIQRGEPVAVAELEDEVLSSLGAGEGSNAEP